MIQKINPHAAQGCNRSPPLLLCMYFQIMNDANLESVPSTTSEVLALSQSRGSMSPTLLRALPPGFSNLPMALKGQTFSVPSCWPLHKILAKKSSIDIVLHRVYHIYDNELREQFINFVEKRIMLICSQNFDCHIQI